MYKFSVSAPTFRKFPTFSLAVLKIIELSFEVKVKLNIILSSTNACRNAYMTGSVTGEGGRIYGDNMLHAIQSKA